MVRPLNSSSPQSALLLVRFFAIRGTLSVLLVLFFLTLATLLHGQAPASLSAAPIPDRILDRVSEDNLTTIHGNTHPALRRAIDMGRLPPSTEMADLVLVLTRSEAQQAALEALNKEQYDPASPLYHHWLTPDQFGAAYGVSPYDLNAITNWLQNHGFTIQEIPPSHTSIRFSGNAAQVESAFHTEMHSIQSNGVAHIANSTDIQIPAALSPVVAGVKSLHNFFPKPQHHAISRSFSQNSIALKGAAADAAPASFSGGLNQISGPKPEYSDSGYQLLVPYDMATIYNYKSLWTASTPITGTGQTIAIAGTSNIVLSDVASFRAATGLPANVPQVIVTNSDPGTTALLDDRFENTLDVEWSGGAAPGASIVLVTSSQTSQTTDALYASESYIINHNVAKIMSVSYGECELGMGTAGNQEYLNLWQQAYSQGIAVFVSSGDSAAAVCDDGNANSGTDYAAEYGTSVSGMTSTPYNVSVGGTDFAPSETGWNATNSSTNMSNATGYIAEIPWDDTVTNPWIISIYNTNYGLNYTAEQWANWFLNNEGINGYDYDGLIPPVGGSGGVSGCTTSSNGTPSSCGGGYPKPAWQAGVTGILSSDKRTVPDLSFFASSGFMGVAYLICDTQPPGFSGPIACSYPANSFDMAVGGTSVSSPVMAGVMALINQKAGAPQGNPNTALYGLAAKQNYSNCSAEKATNSSSCYFNDIDTGTIATPCFGGSVDCTPQIQSDVLGILPGYAATTGYDKATGLGSLNVANVVNGWPAASTSGPAATISPASLSFASTLVGASSAAQTVTLTNSGTNTLTISGITLTGANTAAGATISIPFTQTSTCGAALAANASCTVSVTFKPTAIGAATATLTFADNAPSATQSVALTGYGATSGPSATLSPTSLTFASTTTGASSASQNVTLTNTGNAALTITNIALTGTNAASFARVNNCGTTVAAGAFCTVSIIFAPTASGAASATLSISDNAANAPQTVALSGIGTAPVTVSASVSPTSLTFPSTSVGTTSATQTVTFTNTGSATLSSLQAVLTGNNAALFRGASSCTGSLAAGSSCLMNFTFIPNAAGSFSATLTIQSSTAGYSAKTLTLTGISVAAPAASFSPSSLAFPSTIVGASSATQSFSLTNTGGSALVLASIVTSGANPTSFSQTNNCGTINAGASCTITVTFKPAVAGALSASLSFKNNAANSPQTVTLTGTGLPQPTVSLTPTSLSFASTTVGASATAQTVTLKNTGTSALTLSGISISGANSSSFTQTTTCATSLAAGASCTATVLFKPTTAGTLAA
ncbi:MAG: choice-of-anchor D domain-containing protein, partial [Terracidiphilus sp.]